MMFYLKRKKQRGISLLEVLLSLSVIAIVLVMATRYYRNAQQSQQIANALSMLSGIVTAETQYAAANNNTYVDLATLRTAGYLPANFIHDPWGNTIQYAAASPGYTITMGPTPSVNACNILAGMVNSGSGTAVCNGTSLAVTYQ